VVTKVVEVGSERYPSAGHRRERSDRVEQRRLAVKAAVSVVRHVIGPVEFIGAHLQMRQAVLAGEGTGVTSLGRREAGGDGGDGKRAVAEHAVRDDGEECRVGPTGERDEQARLLFEPRRQPINAAVAHRGGLHTGTRLARL
jgi:hypothetical protein